MRGKVLKAITDRYTGLSVLKLAMWEDEDTVLVNLMEDLNDEIDENELLIIIKDLFR